MSGPGPTGTSTVDIAVSLQSVSKRFYQKQKASTIAGAFRSMLKPQFRATQALDNVTFSVNRGEILAYAGPNGAGKSTTIRMLAGLLVPDSGSVSVMSQNPVTERVAYMKRAGVLFGQRTELWWDHAVDTSFEWKKTVWDIPQHQYASTRDTLVELLGIGPFLKVPARELSLGQRMRADLAMTLLHSPEIILLDEPTLGLDVLAKREIIGFLKQTNRDRGTTIIVTSHDMDDLMEMAGRIILLDKGRIAYDGSFENLRGAIGGQRVLIVTTTQDRALELQGATWLESRGRQHSYAIDMKEASIVSVIRQIPADILVDIETVNPPLEEQIAELYRLWA